MEEIILRSLHGETSAAEEYTLSAWRKGSSSNEEQYRDLERLWRVIRDAGPSPSSSLPSVKHIIDAAGTGGSRRPHAPKRRGNRRPRAAWGAAAAAAAILAFGISQFRSAGETNAAISRVAELSTGVGEMATLRLADGTVVRLASESRLRFTGTHQTREVWLDGRAFFAVAKQEGVPFRVRSRAGDALVLGTRFAIRVEEEDLHLLVVEGRVALSSGEERVEVTAGELSHVVPGAEPTVVKVPDVQPMLEWVGEFLVFQSTPLDQFAREFEQHYGIEVRILDEDLAERTVTAWFTDQPAEEVLMMICHAADVHCSIRGEVAVVEP